MAGLTTASQLTQPPTQHLSSPTITTKHLTLFGLQRQLEQSGPIQFLLQKNQFRIPEFCPACQGKLKLAQDAWTDDGFCLKCKEKKCKRRFSIRTSSWYSHIRLSLSTVLYLVYMWCWRFKSFQIIHELEISKHTCADYKNMLREVCFNNFFGNCQLVIGGPGHIVQVDETCLVKRKYNVGRVPEKSHVWFVF